MRYIPFISINIARVEDECNIHTDEWNISHIARKKSDIIIIIHTNHFPWQQQRYQFKQERGLLTCIKSA